MNHRVLISSFEPFNGESVNPSQQVADALAHEYETINLPVTRYLAAEMLIEKVEDYRPDILIMLGEAGGSKEVRLERVAINLDDFPIPDQQENQPKEEIIFSDGPAAYFSTLPLPQIRETLLDKDIPCVISNSAGTYLCNHIFYSLRHQFNSIQAGFIHLPYLPEQITEGKDIDTASMELETMIKAIRKMIQEAEKNNFKDV